MSKSNNKKQQIIVDLIKKINRMTIPILYRELIKLDDERKEAVINKLSPDKFRLLVVREMSKRELTTELWESSVSIEKYLLDVLSPRQLSYIGRKQLAGDVAWGKWKDLDEEVIKNPGTLCKDLADYFLVCDPKRAISILSFFLGSTVGVSAPAEEREHDIFRYTEGKQFPFEVISLISSMHPKILFPAMNKLTVPFLKKMFWLCSKMQGDNDSIESVFASSYASGHGQTAHISSDTIEIIVTASPLLEDKQLFLLLRECAESTQQAITKIVGKSRLFKMKTEGYLFGEISVDPSIKLRNDRVPNEVVIKKLLSGQTSTKKLGSRKAVELLGEMVA